MGPDEQCVFNGNAEPRASGVHVHAGALVGEEDCTVRYCQGFFDCVQVE
jgi:hypothetical protein